jgi:hypothetical protein
MTKLVEIAIEYRSQTDRAVQFQTGFGEKWIPKSLIEDWDHDAELSDLVELETIEIPEWFAVKEGII